MMSSQVAGPRRGNSISQKRGASKKPVSSDDGSHLNGLSPSTGAAAGGERTVKKLRLSKALTIPEGTTANSGISPLLRMVKSLPCLISLSASMMLFPDSRKLPSKAVPLLLLLKGSNASGEPPTLQVMTPDPECATVDSTILDALHIMHDGKFLHLPVVDRDGNVAACVDVLQITHAAISMVDSSSGAVNDMASTMMQKFWDSALALEPANDYETHSEMSEMMASEGTEQGKFYPSLGLGNSFSFKFEDRKGRVHRFTCGAESISELVSAVMQRIGAGEDQDRPQLLYEDDEGDRVLLSTDSDLVSALSHARSAGQKVLRLHLDFSDSGQQVLPTSSISSADTSGSVFLYSGIVAGAVAFTGIGENGGIMRQQRYCVTVIDIFVVSSSSSSSSCICSYGNPGSQILK
ncbi:hypothetical protein ACFE04_016645 [Oxalis oulophora]